MTHHPVFEIRENRLGLRVERDKYLEWEHNPAETRAAIKGRVDAWFVEGEALMRRRVRQVAAGNSTHTLLEMPTMHGEPQLGPILAAILGPKALAAALCAFADAVPASPSRAAKAKRLADIEAELLRLEIEEEDLIEASELTGTPIARRADADPAVVLRVKG